MRYLWWRMTSANTRVAQRRLYRGNLRLLTVNDVYTANSIDGTGGWAQLQTLIQKHRTRNTLLCVNGDFLGGSPLAEHFNGANVIDILNKLKVDLACIGNHEFDYGPEVLKQRMQQSKFLWLGTNVRDKAQHDSAFGLTADQLYATLQLDEVHEDKQMSDGQLHWNTDELIQQQKQLVQQQQQKRDDAAKRNNSETSTTAAAAAAAAASSASATSHCDPADLNSPCIPNGLAPTQLTLEPETALEPLTGGAVRISLFGLCTQHTPQLSWPGPTVSFHDVPSVATQLMKRVSRQHSDVFLALTHLPMNEDVQLAKKQGKLSLILGGHDHDCMAVMEESTLIFKAGQNANWLGVVDLRIELEETEIEPHPDLKQASDVPESAAEAPHQTEPEPSTTRPSSNSTSTPKACKLRRQVRVFPSHQLLINRGYAIDPEVQSLIDSYQARMDKSQSSQDLEKVLVTIGTGQFDEHDENVTNNITIRKRRPNNTNSTLATHNATMQLPLSMNRKRTIALDAQRPAILTRSSVVRQTEAVFADLLADSMSDHYYEDGCDAAVINGGFVRGDRSYPAGHKLTVRDVLTELPFPKVLVLLKLSGRGLLQAINDMLAKLPAPAGCFPHLSYQLSATYDRSDSCTTPHQRIKSLHIYGQPVDPDGVYKIATTTFLAGGGDGIRGFLDHGTKISNDEFKVSDVAIKYLEKVAILEPILEHRLMPIDVMLKDKEKQDKNNKASA